MVAFECIVTKGKILSAYRANLHAVAIDVVAHNLVVNTLGAGRIGNVVNTEEIGVGRRSGLVDGKILGALRYKHGYFLPVGTLGREGLSVGDEGRAQFGKAVLGCVGERNEHIKGFVIGIGVVQLNVASIERHGLSVAREQWRNEPVVAVDEAVDSPLVGSCCKLVTLMGC